MNRNIYFLLISLIATVYFAYSSPIKETANPALTLWYPSPAQKWTNALPLGNGRLGAMVYGGIDTAHYKLNEESLWAGSQGNPIAENFKENLKIDSTGRLMEWSQDYKENIATHRHFSHLLAAHPFAIINKDDTPELLAAAEKSLDVRFAGRKGSTGWSGAQAAILRAWFADSDGAYNGLKHFLAVKSNKTFMHMTNIFQIDANFGLTSAIAEMLIQSHRTDEDGKVIIALLPAIPADWNTGRVTGLCTRGGFVIDMAWEKGEIISAEITSKTGGDCKVKIQDKLADISLKKGETRELVSI